MRELKNVMDYVAATVSEPLIERWHLPSLTAPPAAPRSLAPAPSVSFRPIGDEVRDLEKSRMQQALDVADGNQTRAAALLAMPLRTFVTKVKVYGLKP